MAAVQSESCSVSPNLQLCGFHRPVVGDNNSHDPSLFHDIINLGLFLKLSDYFYSKTLICVVFVLLQMKLLNLYIKRAQTTNSNSSSSSDVSSHS